MSLSSSEGTGVGYVLEGAAFYDYPPPCAWGLLPFYRLSSSTGEHFYTASQGEHDALVGSGWNDEGNVGCISATATVGCGAVELHRLAATFHYFTTSGSEAAGLVASGWIDEGAAGWVWTGP